MGKVKKVQMFNYPKMSLVHLNTVPTVNILIQEGEYMLIILILRNKIEKELDGSVLVSKLAS